MSQMGAIAAFDFDGTLTNSDTLLRFIRRRRGSTKLAIDLVITSPLLARYMTGRLNNDVHKMTLFARAWAQCPEPEFLAAAQRFADEEVPTVIRPEALARVAFHRDRGHRVVVVTASPIDWVVPWATTQGISEVIGNRAEVADGKVTGRLAGINCYGSEKLRRLLSRFPNRTTYELYAYGDGRGDRELLGAADHPYFRRFA